MPVRPSRADAGPSCICPPLKSESSWAWMATKRPLTLTYCSARRVSAAVGSGLAVVAEADGAGGAELAHLGELLARRGPW